jgi:SagB-type dehydrogenase family enzyme
VPQPRSIAERYHRLTKYTEENVRPGPGLDWSTQPTQYKEIVSQHRVSLRPYLPVKLPGQKVDAPAPGSEEVARLSRLLFHTNGLTGFVRYGAGEGQLLRAAPSAGALYPTEIYAAVRDVQGLAPGLYNYQVPTHELVHLWEGDQFDEIKSACGGAARVDDTELCLIFTGVFWRSAWRYQERGYRRVLLDTGHVLANLTAYAPHAGVTAHPHLGFVDSAVNGLFFFDDAVEGALACVPVTEGVGPSDPGPLWASPTAEVGDLKAVVIQKEADLAESATVALHRASSCWESFPASEARESEPSVSERSIPLAPPADFDLPRTILYRRSARSYRGASIPLDALGQALGFGLGRASEGVRPVRFATHDRGLLRCYVVALDVDGLDTGLYRVEGAGEALLPLAIGGFGTRLQHLSLGQEIAGRCSAVVAFAAPADESLALCGDRAYRYLHLEAGGIGERIQLAVRGLGLGTCGIGGFFDDEAATLLDGSPDDFVLYLVTIGQESAA